MDTDERARLIERKFEILFGEPATILVRAPGRVDLMGSHTDYNLGFVMTMTIDRDTWIAASPRADGMVSVHSLNLPGGGTFPLDNIEHDPDAPWTNYVRGVSLVMRKAGFELTGFNGLVHSTVPFGSGLSSSAAIEMATAELFQVMADWELDPVEKAILGQKAENEFVGVSSGILDQYSSSMGRAGSVLLLDCRDLTSETVNVAEGLQVVICDTRAERNLTGTEYDERRAQCEQGVKILQRWYPEIRALRDVSIAQLELHADALPEIVVKRCRFIIEENQRVLDLATAIGGGNREAISRLLCESYAGARNLYELTVPAMEKMFEAMISAPGVIGARQAGAGFGGCMVAIIEAGQLEQFTSHVNKVYTGATGIETSVFPVSPSDGAGLVAR